MKNTILHTAGATSLFALNLNNHELLDEDILHDTDYNDIIIELIDEGVMSSDELKTQVYDIPKEFDDLENENVVLVKIRETREEEIDDEDIKEEQKEIREYLKKLLKNN